MTSQMTVTTAPMVVIRPRSTLATCRAVPAVPGWTGSGWPAACASSAASVVRVRVPPH